jgi:small subunit ribosomal protein S8
MNTTDPIADMLTRIRNASQARHVSVLIPASKLKLAVANILKSEGYVRDFELTRDKPERLIKIWLKYTPEKKPMIGEMTRVSKPGRRVYTPRDEIPFVKGGFGVAIMSTPKGVLTGSQAWRQGVGGEVLCFVS